MRQNEQIIIGLAGTFASGKDTLANWMAHKYDLNHISTGDIIRDDTLKIYGNTDRPTLKKHANELRENKSAGILVEMALKRHQALSGKFKGIVISGIRSVGEAETIKEVGGKLVFIDADPKIRYLRAKSRQRDVEKDISFEEFLVSEQKEMKSPHLDKTSQNILAVKTMSDEILINSHEPEDLFQMAKESSLFKA